MRLRVRFILISLLLVMLSAVGHSAEKKQILILNSYHKGYPWTDCIVKGIEKTLTERIGNCEILIEYMDTKRINTDEYKEAFFRLMKMKYTKINLDIIIVSDDNAFLFAVKYHKRLFGNIPIVFVGVNDFDLSMIDGHEEQITGMVQDADIPATLNTALELHPNTTQIAVICDATTTGQAYIRQASATESQFETLKFIYLDGAELTTSEMLARLSSLPNNSIALLCIWLKDKNGIFVPEEKGYPDISKNSPVPLYGVLEPMLQYGILGGKVQSGEHHGAEAAKIALKLLEGKKVTDIPVRLKSPNTYMFNYKQLQRWNIQRTALPQGSIIINEPKSIYYQYKNIVWGIMGAFAFLLVVIAALSSNILRRKSAEKNLRESEEKFKSLANNLNVGIYRNTVGAKGKFIEANPAIVEMFGFDSREEFLKVRVSDLYKNPYDRNEYNAKILKEGAVINKELQLQKKDGTAFIGSISAVVVKDEIDEVKYYDGIIEDISVRKRAEAALRESEEKYRTVLEANPDPVVVYDIEGKVTYFNPAFTRVFGWTLEERLGKKMDVFVPEEAWRETKMMIEKVLAGERFSGIETCRYNKKGEIIPVSLSGAIYKDQNANPIGSIINLRDISDQKKMKAQLQQAQKMEAIGTLAGGIAHDFNNILSAILGYSELVLADLPSEASIRNKLEAIHSSGERARDLVAQILAFSRKDEQVRSPVEVHLILKDALKLLRPAIPTTIEIQTQISSKCRILGDPSRIHQIIMNLCTNAYQAMLETGGTLKISLSHVKIEGKAAALAQVPAGSYGKLVISDTGVGIPLENLERIFDPYFTTKEKGKGTGLGLAAVHGIVKSHGGAILVESQIGKSTKFEVYLPLTLDRSDTQGQAESQITGGNERILLVDDEHDILEIENEMLKKLGYIVTTKDNAKDALKLFAEQPEQFDLVITDMTMPDMTGDRLADELIKISSDIPIILCTGFSELMSKEKAESLGIKGFLLKPIAMRDLSNMIRIVLDDKEDSIKD